MNIGIGDRVSTKPGRGPQRDDQPIERIGIGFYHGELRGDLIFVRGLPYLEEELVVTRHARPQLGELVQTEGGQWHMIGDRGPPRDGQGYLKPVVARIRPQAAEERRALTQARYQHLKESSGAESSRTPARKDWWARCWWR